jgi:arylsulfatase A-like enzyme
MADRRHSEAKGHQLPRCWRVPCTIRWPGMIKPGAISNEIFSHTDMLPTLAAVAGEPDIVGKLKKGYKSGSKTFKVHQ